MFVFVKIFKMSQSFEWRKRVIVVSNPSLTDPSLTETLRLYSPDDIFNTDETPYISLIYQYESLSSSKNSLKRLTVLLCTNMSGTDIKKLLVIGKNLKPRCFKGLSVEICLLIFTLSSFKCVLSHGMQSYGKNTKKCFAS